MPSLKTRLRITEKCLRDCWYCYVPKTGKEMSLDTAALIRDKLKEIYDKGNYSRIKVSLTGGDPTLHPNFLEITKLFLDTFPKINIMTDVCSSANFEVVKKFVELGGSYLVSLNEDPIDSIMELAKFAKERKRLNYLNVLFTPFNIDRLDEILNKLVIENKFNIRFNHLYDLKASKNFRESILQAIEKIGKFLLDHNHIYYNYLFGLINIDKNRDSYCGYGKNFYYFNTNGDVHRCNEEGPICNVYDSDIEKIKCNIEISDKCKNCSDYKYCLGGCFFTNKGNGEYCREYSTFLRFIKELKNKRTRSTFDQVEQKVKEGV